MNKDSVTFLFNILNSVRGEVAVVDYPFVVLPALILEWAEQKNKEGDLDAYKEIYSPARLAATYGGADTAEHIIQYLIQIEESQENIIGGYISEAFSVLEKTPAKCFSEILKSIADIGFLSSHNVYDYATAFLDFYYMNNKNSANGGLSTKGVRQIEKIALGLTEDEDTVFDGFAGTGIAALNATSECKSIILQDISRSMACIEEMLCIMRGCVATINVQDSLLVNDTKRYSRVIIEPPFLRSVAELRNRNLSYYSPDPDVMCIKYALSKMTDDGKAVVLCPAGVLFRSGKTSVEREMLVRNRYIDTVIQLPQGSIYGTGVSTAILILRKKKYGDEVLFVDASQVMNKAKQDLILNDAALLYDIIMNRKVIEGISCIVPLQALEDHEFSLVITQYIRNTAVETAEIDLSPLVEKKERLLSELIEIDKALKIVRKENIN